jgi:microsomal dipeptidase-like Zn-dependent dipeptidase
MTNRKGQFITTETLLGTYLKDRRAKLDPAASGFPPARRRTPGLRREEVAQRQSAGLSAPEEDRPPYVEGMNAPRKLEILTDVLLSRGHSARVIDKVLGANFMRTFRESWTT